MPPETLYMNGNSAKQPDLSLAVSQLNQCRESGKLNSTEFDLLYKLAVASYVERLTIDFFDKFSDRLSEWMNQKKK